MPCLDVSHPPKSFRLLTAYPADQDGSFVLSWYVKYEADGTTRAETITRINSGWHPPEVKKLIAQYSRAIRSTKTLKNEPGFYVDHWVFYSTFRKNSWCNKTASFHEYLVKNRALGDKEEEQDAYKEIETQLVKHIRARLPDAKFTHDLREIMSKIGVSFEVKGYKFGRVQFYINLNDDGDDYLTLIVEESKQQPRFRSYRFNIDWPHVDYDAVVSTAIHYMNSTASRHVATALVLMSEREENIVSSWEELGVEDPNIKWPEPVKYTDEAISSKAPRPYGFGYDSNKPVWDKMRNHPGYIEMVRNMLLDVVNQLDRIKRKVTGKPTRELVDELTNTFGRLMTDSNEIAKEIGWGDHRDIVIAAQHHPFVLELIKKRDILYEALKKRKKKGEKS
jgi:hypothetical protein